MPSSTSVLIRSRSVRSAKVSRAQPRTRRKRSSTSIVSRTSTFWDNVQVGRVARHVGQPARLGDVAQLGGDPAGASAEQDVLENRPVLPGQFSGRGGRLALESGSASTHSAAPVPGTPVPMVARWSPRTATA